jgi:aminoglycoside 3-N-acetyltransferase
MAVVIGHDRASLAADLRELGLGVGDAVLVHSSMRSIGRVAGGAATLLAAFRDVLGPTGTLVVPAQTPDNSVTSDAFQRATAGMSQVEKRAYERSMPGFDRKRSPSFGVGAFAEYVRRLPDAVRSAHPQTSFSAVGARAATLMGVHDLHSHLGERSPVSALDAVGARSLMLGVGYESCTALHLAEYRRSSRPPMQRYRCYVRRGRNGRQRWEFRAPRLDAAPFAAIGREIELVGVGLRGRVGDAEARLMSIRPAVKIAIEWMDHNSAR